MVWQRFFLRIIICLPTFLATPPLLAAPQKRPLDLTPCDTQFENYRQASLANSQQRLDAQRARRTPNPKAVSALEQEITEAQEVSGLDFTANRFGSGSATPEARMRDFVQGLSLANARDRQKEDRAMLHALEIGDYAAYEDIKGARPENPVAAAYLKAMSEADLCTWEARMMQITGKAAFTDKTSQANAVHPESSKSSPAKTAQGSSMPAQECAAKKQEVSRIQIPDDASITASHETVMFMSRTILDMIAGGCPVEPGITQAQITAERQLRQQQYAAAESACNAVQLGGRYCVAWNHFGPETATRKTPAPAPAPQKQAVQDTSFECELDPRYGKDYFGEMRSKEGYKIVANDPVTGRSLCSNERAPSLPKSTRSNKSSSDWETSPGIRH